MRTAYTYPIQHRLAFVLAFAYMLVMNYLANSLPFNGRSTESISDGNPTLITPAGYAFIIWGLIYLSMAIFTYYQLRRGKDVRFFRLIWPWLLINFVANGLWLKAFHNEWFILSVLLMLLMLFTLMKVFRFFYRLRKSIATTHRFFFQVPFSIYFGWLSAAAAVNIAVLLKSIIPAIPETSEIMIAMITLTALGSIGLLIVLRFQDYLYALTIVWALIAIWLGDGLSKEVRNYSQIAGIALLVVVIGVFVYDRIKVARYGRQLSR